MSHGRVVHQIATDTPPMKWQTNVDSHASSTTIDCSSLHQTLVFPCVWVSTEHGTDVNSTIPVKPTPTRSDNENTPWEDSGLMIIQHQARKASWVDQWEATASIVDVHWSIHWRWVKVSCNVQYAWMSARSHVFGGGIDVTAHRCHQILDQMTVTTTHRTESQLRDLGGWNW